MRKVKTNYIIMVSQEHIDHGAKKNCGNCPLALAIKEVIDAPCEVGTESVVV